MANVNAYGSANGGGTVAPGTRTPPTTTTSTDHESAAGTPWTSKATTAGGSKAPNTSVKTPGIDWVDALTYAAYANQNAGYATPPQRVKQPNAASTVQKSQGITDNWDPSTIESDRVRPSDPNVAKGTGHIDANGNLVIDSTKPPVDPNADGNPKPDGEKPYADYYENGSSSGGGSGSGGGASGGNGTGYSDAELLAQALKAAGITADPYQLPTINGPNPERLQHVDTTELQNLLQQIVDTQKQQGNAQIDYGVEQGVNELTRAMEDAALQYQTQRNQATADELRALDNQALYAEARGDRGGIGEAQYASIQNTAAQNRRAVNDAQTKLGTDTARQIADLRSQGEFKKADQLLSITQSYLKDLMGLEQWALEANLSVDQFNSQLQQWVDEYNLNVQKFLTDLDLSASQLTGVFANGKATAAAKQQLNESLASSGSALLSAGVLPSKQQLDAMGMTEVQAKAYIKKITAK